MKKILAAFLGALIAFVWSAIAHQNPLTMALGLSVLGPKEDAVHGYRSFSRKTSSRIKLR
jgi:hypothetical protein